MNQTKIKGGCQSGRKVVTDNSKSDLPLGRLSCWQNPLVTPIFLEEVVKLGTYGSALYTTILVHHCLNAPPAQPGRLGCLLILNIFLCFI